MALAAAATLLLAACGGGSDSPQDEAANLAIASAKAEGVDLDEGCVRDLAGGLSDEDAQAIIEAGTASDAELSDSGLRAAASLLDCVDRGEFVDQMMEQIGDTPGLDADCMRDALTELDLANFDPEDPGFAAAMIDCVDLSSLGG
jgi:hypothetical protein